MSRKKIDTTTKIIIGVAIATLGAFVVYKISKRKGGKKGDKNDFRKKLVDIGVMENLKREQVQCITNLLTIGTV